MSIDVRPAAEEVVAYIGATLKLTYTVVDADGEAVDLSGATGRMLLKRSPDDADDQAVAQFSIDTTNAVAGEFTATLPASATAQLEPGVYYADHHIRIAEGDSAGDYIVASFVIRFERPVTRSVS